MIHLSIPQAILFYMGGPLIVLFILWFWREYKESCYLRHAQDHAGYVVACPFCLHVFLDTTQDTVKQCPMCDHYFRKDDTEKEIPHDANIE